MTTIAASPISSDQPLLTAGIVAVESTSHVLHVRDQHGNVHAHLPAGPGGPPPWEVTAAVLAAGDSDHADLVIIAGSQIPAGSPAHFGWLRAIKPSRLLVCRRSVQILWRHPAGVDATVDQRLAAYADIAATIADQGHPLERLRQIGLREVTELDTDVASVLDMDVAR